MTTGWATYAVLLGVSTLGAVAGLALGAFDGAVLRSLPERVVGLLEHDLLQALVLYAVVGALLNHLALVNGLYSGLRKLLARVVGLRAAPDMAGLGVGTGSAFALLPAQNATGNWIKVVQRVPVRIALDPKEVAEHPLRVGLSMEVKVDTADQSGKTLADTQRTTPVAATAVFD
eukprot:gene19754-27967_t